MTSLYAFVHIPASYIICEIIPDSVLRKNIPIWVIYPYSGMFETISGLIRICL